MWLSLMLQQFHGATITHFRANVGDMQPKRLAVGLRERLVKHQFGGDKFQHLSGFLNTLRQVRRTSDTFRRLRPSPS